MSKDETTYQVWMIPTTGELFLTYIREDGLYKIVDPVQTDNPLNFSISAGNKYFLEFMGYECLGEL